MKQDVSKFINQSDKHQYAAVAYFTATIIYLTFLITTLNISVWWISIPFLLTQIYMFLLVALSIRNNWNASYRVNRPELPDPVPTVAVIVTVYNESIEILKRTVKSLLHIDYPGEVVVIVSCGLNDSKKHDAIRGELVDLAGYWERNLMGKVSGKRQLIFRYSDQAGNAKAGNMNNTLDYINKYFPEIDFVLTQDTDEIVHPDILKAIIGYFNDPKVAYVQTIKQSKISDGDPFGNQDLMWYGRTAPSRDFDNAMYSCGSGVVWRVSAVRSVGGFNTWNLVEDMTTSYNLLAQGWQGRYHYEALSKGLAPEDLPNFIKQRGTWAIDTMRMFFWDNPLKKKGLSIKQKLQFLETPLFYLNGFNILFLVLVTSLSLITSKWPTTASATMHAVYLLPSVIFLEIYFVTLGDQIFFRRVRQYWSGLSPVFVLATAKALFYGPNKKPKYVVTRKENSYGNYISMVWPQILILSILVLSLLYRVLSTPLYSAFDWVVVFWGVYQASYFVQIIKVSMYKYQPEVSISFELDPVTERLRNLRGKLVDVSYSEIGKTAFRYASTFMVSVLFIFLRKTNN
jgi:cellulose synthase (UDP-forming)